MTPSELQELDSNPLWSTEGQILWLFGEQEKEGGLLTAAEVASRLSLSPPTVSYALRRLLNERKVATWEVDKREVWGTGEQVAAWRAERRLDAQKIERERLQAREQVLKDNEALKEAETRLREVCAGRGVDVSVFRGFETGEGGPRRLSLLLSVDDPEAAAWLVGRMSRPVPDEDAPSDEEWAEHAEHLETLVSCFEWAGWSEGEHDYFHEYDDETGPILYTTMRRTCMAFDVEYHPSNARLRLLHDDYPGGWPQIFSMLDDEVVIELDGDADEQQRLVAERAGALGLLDATRVEVDPDSDVTLRQFMDVQLTEFVFDEIAGYRQKTVVEVVDGLDADTYLRTFFSTVVDGFGQGVLPDLVPDAAVHGIAAWCWRNDTAVEAWHVPDDVLMARINIAVTRKIAEHVDPDEGVDWIGLEAALTDPEWALPDGRTISALFGEGWQEVRGTVSENLTTWCRLDEDLLGPTATLRLLTIGGSTSYTWHWWGQGRWTAICQAIVEDAVAGGIALPVPYDQFGPERFVIDVAEPDQLGDDVLEWLIDMPAAGVDGPRGLRFHAASKPISRMVEPVDWNLGQPPATATDL